MGCGCYSIRVVTDKFVTALLTCTCGSTLWVTMQKVWGCLTHDISANLLKISGLAECENVQYKHVRACAWFSAVERCVFGSELRPAQHEHMYAHGVSRGSIWASKYCTLKYLQGWTQWTKCIKSGVFTQVAPYCHKYSHKHTPTQSKVFWVWK